MKFRNCLCERVPDRVRLWGEGTPVGAFYWGKLEQGDWSGDCLWIKMPYEPTHSGHPWHSLAVYRPCDPKPEHGWEWDGNLNKPTLSPSIACGPREARTWHGNLLAGVLVACE